MPQPGSTPFSDMFAWPLLQFHLYDNPHPQISEGYPDHFDDMDKCQQNMAGINSIS